MLLGQATHLIGNICLVKNVQKESQVTKQITLSWFQRFQSFRATVPKKSYAQALKTNATVPVHKSSYMTNEKFQYRNVFGKKIK